MLVMLTTNGPQKGRLIQWNDEAPLRLGRTNEASVVLDDPKMSPTHAEVVQRGGQWFIRDLGSEAGTFVNLVRIKDYVRLSDGDQIIMGDSILSFCSAPTVLTSDDTSMIDLSGNERAAEYREALPKQATQPITEATSSNEATPTDEEGADSDWLSALTDTEPWDEDAGDADDAQASRSQASPPEPAEQEDVFDGWSAAMEAVMADAMGEDDHEGGLPKSHDPGPDVR